MTARKRDIDRKAQAGFTLIELIAVIVILGILAAVAVPKYLDIQTEAQAKTIEAALGAGASNASLTFAKYIAVNSSTPTGITDNAWTGTGTSQAIEEDLGDFTASYSYTSPDVTVTITAGPSWFAASTATKTKTFALQ